MPFLGGPLSDEGVVFGGQNQRLRRAHQREIVADWQQPVYYKRNARNTPKNGGSRGVKGSLDYRAAVGQRVGF
jgi:hypothetical protein